MNLHKILAAACTAALLAPLFCGLPAANASADFETYITIAAPNTPTGCAAPLAAFDCSVAPFDKGGPFTVSGYYKCRLDGVMYKDGMTGGSANVFGISVADTAGQWKAFTASFSTAPSLTYKGIDLWYMAGELSLGGVVIKNAAGQVVYDMDSDPALTPVKTAALLRKGIWYLYTFSSHPDYLFTVTAPEAALTTVQGSRYELGDNVLRGVPYGTDVLTVRSNLTHADRITAWCDGKKLSDADFVTPQTQLVYNHGQADSVTICVSDMVGDLNHDGKLDIRDLRLAKKLSFGDSVSADPKAADIDGSAGVNEADVSAIREAVIGKPLVAAQSIGAEALLELAAPIGRLHRDNHMLLMEHSACNFTLTGDLQGEVTAKIWTERTSASTDPIGLFIEVDGVVRYQSVTARSQYSTVTLAKDLKPGAHTIRVYKASDAANDVISVSAVRYVGRLTKSPAADRRIEFLGDSITAGADVFPLGSMQRQRYGALTSYYSYARFTADALGASYYSVANSGWRLCYSLNPQYTIRSVYPYQSMRSAYAGGEYDFAWKPQVVVINLGTNDRYSATEGDYQTDVRQLLELVRQKNPEAAIFWAYGAMDQAHPSNRWIRSAVEEFAATDGNAYYVALPQSNAGANAHPDKAGQQAIADALSDAIRKVMGW